ncbi:AAA family ATPase [candidate division WWE3 bacterium]|uniref:AAA family ATPase n=1 Tax=candidate division WWE3 bacterium TaxID=2053526 RepID=A0A955LHD7_UNCKA|nr:AAA family ATPase [candidate division WWE3 bacterium]
MPEIDPIQSMLDRTETERTDLDAKLKDKPLLLFFIGQKASGKGTRSKLLQKAFPDHFEQISAGDLARELQQRLSEEDIEKVADELAEHFPENISREEIHEMLEPFVELEGSRLKATEVILALIKKALADTPEKSIILDGFPRSPEQVENALELIDHFEQEGYYPLFVNVDTPYEVRDARMRHRRVCPICQNSKNITLWPSTKFDYDPDSGEVFMLCDEENCELVRMVAKDYDDQGAEAMKDRDQITQDLVDHLHEHHPEYTVSIKNAIPEENVDQYEPHDLTEVTNLEWDPEKKEVVVSTEPWVLEDEEGKKYYSGNPETWVVDFIKELHKHYED